VALNAATLVMLPKVAGSKFMVTLAAETSAGLVSEILNCANPPGGAVSLETCSVMLGFAAKRTFDSSVKNKTGLYITLFKSLTVCSLSKTPALIQPHASECV
jgi:hypothetical protein